MCGSDDLRPKCCRGASDGDLLADSPVPGAALGYVNVYGCACVCRVRLRAYVGRGCAPETSARRGRNRGNVPRVRGEGRQPGGVLVEGVSIDVKTFGVTRTNVVVPTASPSTLFRSRSQKLAPPTTPRVYDNKR